eukprot:281492_1
MSSSTTDNTENETTQVLFENTNPIDIVLELLRKYPQMERWLLSMEYHQNVTTHPSHAVQFLTAVMSKQPEFTQIIQSIKQQLKPNQPNVKKRIFANNTIDDTLPLVKKRKLLSQIQSNHHKIQVIIDKLFDDTSNSNTNNYINELSSILSQMNNANDKKRSLNLLYKYNVMDCGDIMGSLLNALINEYHPHTQIETQDIQRLVSILVDHGINLMCGLPIDESQVINPALYESYHSFSNLKSIQSYPSDFMLPFKINMINKFQLHEFHSNYFTQNKTSLITLAFWDMFGNFDVPDVINPFKFINMQFAHELFGHRLTRNHNFTVHAVQQCMQNLLDFNFLCIVVSDRDISMDLYAHHKIMAMVNYNNVDNIVKAFSNFISVKKDWNNCYREVSYLFIITEMMKRQQKNILSAINNNAIQTLSSDILSIVSQYVLTDLSFFNNELFDFNVWFISCIKSLKKMTNWIFNGGEGPNEKGFFSKYYLDWFDELFKIIKSIDNDYDTILCEYIINLSLDDFVELCCFPYTVYIMVKTVCFVLDKQIINTELRQHNYCRILKDINNKYEDHRKCWGELIANVIHNTNNNSDDAFKKKFIDSICRIIIKHPRFEPFCNKQQILIDAFTTKAKEWNITNISEISQQILDHLAPVNKHSFSHENGYRD